MNKFNSIIYNKLVLQAEEAKLRGMTKLASDVFNAIGAVAEDDIKEYSHNELEEDIKSDLWKMASNVLKHYGIESTNIENINEALNPLVGIILNNINLAIGVTDDKWLSPLEPLVPGEKRKD